MDKQQNQQLVLSTMGTMGWWKKGNLCSSFGQGQYPVSKTRLLKASDTINLGISMFDQKTSKKPEAETFSLVQTFVSWRCERGETSPWCRWWFFEAWNIWHYSRHSWLLYYSLFFQQECHVHCWVFFSCCIFRWMSRAKRSFGATPRSLWGLALYTLEICLILYVGGISILKDWMVILDSFIILCGYTEAGRYLRNTFVGKACSWEAGRDLDV